MDNPRRILQHSSMSRTVLLLAPLLAAALAAEARAVLVAETMGNITAPGDDPGWGNVGNCNSAGAIYLGNQWVLTAFHVNASAGFPVAFNGTTYTTIPSSGVRLTNNGAGGMSAQTDLILFRINGDPGLPTPVISASAPVLGDDIVMIGNGRNRQASRTFWQVTMNPDPALDTWTETVGAHNVEGYKADTGSAKRWGTNDAEAVNVNIDYGVGTVRTFLSLFDDYGGASNEAQAMTGDSGGGVFHKNGAQWELSGVMLAVGTAGNPSFFDNPPADTAAFGQHLTAMADLSFYRNQLLGIIPEPSSALLLAGGLTFMLRRRRNGGS